MGDKQGFQLVFKGACLLPIVDQNCIAHVLDSTLLTVVLFAAGSFGYHWGRQIV